MRQLTEEGAGPTVEPSSATVTTVPWRASDALKGLALVLSGTLVTFGALRWVRDLTGSDPGVPVIALVLGVLPGLMVVAVWAFGIRRYQVPWRTLGLRAPGGWQYLFLPWGVMTLSLVFLGMYTVVVSALEVDLLVPEPVPSWVLGEGAYRLMNAVSLGIVGPLTEELFFRGFVLAALMQPMGAVRAAVVASAIFSASHMNPGVLVPFFVTGLMLSWLYIRSRSIWPSFTAHAAQNLLAVWLTPP